MKNIESKSKSKFKSNSASEPIPSKRSHQEIQLQNQFDQLTPTQLVHLCGVDEAGRGPLAGSVYAAAVILEHPIDGIKDSKKLSHTKRVELAQTIKTHAKAWAVAKVSAQEIDQINILQASLKAMSLAVKGLNMLPTWVIVDGNHYPQGLVDDHYLGGCLIKGDQKVQAIGAASILAKVARDQECCEMAVLYPEYGFDIHKGYPTAMHLQRLAEFGPCAIHRQSYAPVKKLLA